MRGGYKHKLLMVLVFHVQQQYFTISPLVQHLKIHVQQYIIIGTLVLNLKSGCSRLDPYSRRARMGRFFYHLPVHCESILVLP